MTLCGKLATNERTASACGRRMLQLRIYFAEDRQTFLRRSPDYRPNSTHFPRGCDVIPTTFAAVDAPGSAHGSSTVNEDSLGSLGSVRDARESHRVRKLEARKCAKRVGPS